MEVPPWTVRSATNVTGSFDLVQWTLLLVGTMGASKMKGVTGFLMLAAVEVSLHIVVVMAEVHRFKKYDAPTSVNCYDHVTSHGVAATKIACADVCGSNDRCRGFVYDPDTMNCTEIRAINTNYPDRRCKAGIWGFFAKEVPACDQYLVSGPEGVTNSQLSESSTWCAVFGSHLPVCQPASMRYESAWYARLGSQGDTSGCWSAAYEDAAQFVQVDFLQPTTVSSVVLTGRHPGYIYTQYVTSFKFLYSDDCFVFEEIVDENGASVILKGNSDENEVVTRHLPERVQARCFRINPRTWVGWPALRFDLKGCL